MSNRIDLIPSRRSSGSFPVGVAWVASTLEPANAVVVEAVGPGWELHDCMTSRIGSRIIQRWKW
jgi:hypothetical protein